MYGTIDLLVGGTPCQSFSVAGLRGGLDDDRGNLALEFCRLAQREQPRWIVWENVPGVLSSNGGRDFGSILGALEDLGYGLAYRVLDAQYFGVAQRRRRVFVVGYLGDWRPAAAVLFERHSMSGHPAPSRQAREEVAAGAATGAGGSGSVGRERPDLTGPLTAGMHKGPRGTEAVESGHVVAVNIGHSEARLSDVTGTIDCWSTSGRGSSQQLAVMQSRTVTGFYPTAGQDFPALDGLSPAVKVGTKGSSGNPPAIAFTKGDHGQDAGVEISPTLRKGGDGGGQQPAVAYGFNGDQSEKTRSMGEKEEQAPTLRAAAVSHVASAQAFQSTADCLTAAYGTKWNGNASAMNGSLFALQPGVAVGFYANEGTHGAGDNANMSPTLKAHPACSNLAAVATQSAVRRLTPVECERLQGFPDNFTAIPWRKKGAEDCPDGPRYKALGNSMAVPVMRWLGERIQLVDDFVSVFWGDVK